ncbi:MAG: choice-of-anchor B family protein [Balneola sp.]
MKYFAGLILASFLLMYCKSNSTESDQNDLMTAMPEPTFPCEEGLSNGEYPCENIDLMAIVTPQELDGLGISATANVRLNDIWGWTDPLTEKNYALVGLTNGVSFVDITDPTNPIVVGKLDESNISAKYKVVNFEETYPACTVGIGDTQASKSLTEGTTWRDMKVFDNHMFVVSDQQPHGMQSFDLTKLRQYEGDFLDFNEDALYDNLANAHNIVINEETGFAYATGVTQADTCGSRNATGLHIIDINDPKNPVFAGCYFDPATEIASNPSIGNGYIHDAQCVNYNGPDSEHQNKEVCFSSAEGALVIADVTDKQNPTTIGFSGKTRMQYSHQGWLTEDQQYFLMNDEKDEQELGRNTKTYIWDVRDLDNPVFVDFYTHNTKSIDHNMYVKDEFIYAANYNSGLRVLKINDMLSADLSLNAFFDTQPTIDQASFTGTWSSYPYFENGVVIASDIEDGLFILYPKLD